MRKVLLLAIFVVAAIVAHAQIVDAEHATKPSDKTVFYQTPEINKKNTFIVISKTELRLYVYGVVGGDTLLMAKFPACLSKNKGQKQRRGDMKTPECTPAKPFYIDAIKDASAWYHDFKDGRGSIKAYGAWFLRLVTPGHRGIGIHGSTNNESSVPGRASEGCIRLRDPDIILLKERYAYINMPVIIKNETQGPWDWELKAHARAVPVE
ncbi:MAG: L,D-transpeptidase [Muribaculaceae bacterium]|nr:L,D-transpeptidase [Muribaculaceae bacterium]